ncbi:MAG TPA: hypothetical protein VFX59_15325 [Polyangiales bacterium]|nr:hypothetical protein [Polyangiales bacterium]
MTIHPQTWSVEYLFHALHCDVQLAIGPLDDQADAACLAAETPNLRFASGNVFLRLAEHDYLIDPSTLIVHGDLPRSTDSAEPDFALVDAWVFPAHRVASLPRSDSREARLWAEDAEPTIDLKSLHEHVRPNDSAPLSRDCELVRELVEHGWLAEVRDAELGARIVATTRLLTLWPPTLERAGQARTEDRSPFADKLAPSIYRFPGNTVSAWSDLKPGVRW